MDKKDLGTSIRGSKTIILNIQDTDYPLFLEDISFAKKIIEKAIAEDIHEKIFPKGTAEAGFQFKGFERLSKKQNVKKRRIEIGGIIYRIHPAFILSYMRGKVDDVRWALFIMRFGVPFWAIALVFGRNHMYWYRLWLDIGKNSIVGTTIFSSKELPENLLGDEEHTKIKGIKGYIATTVAKGCLLGVSVVLEASADCLCKGYQTARDEILNVNKNHKVKTINTDGWSATQTALKFLYKGTTIIQCFLHGFIKVRHRKTKKQSSEFNIAAEKIWDAYGAESIASFSQRIRRLKEWAILNLQDTPMKDNILNLCGKVDKWKVFYKFPESYRTSNMLDRIMKLMKRRIKNAQYFHSSPEQATLYMRGFALVHNFSPSNPWTVKKHGGLASPAARLNKFVYSDDWCINLMIATSLRGYRVEVRNPL
jgi:hypothetical protein